MLHCEAESEKIVESWHAWASAWPHFKHCSGGSEEEMMDDVTGPGCEIMLKNTKINKLQMDGVFY